MRIASVGKNNFAHLDKFWGCEGVVINDPDQIKDYDLVLLHGGGDVHKSFYDTTCKTSPDEIDLFESACIDRAIELNLRIFGICKGAQWLCLKAGGSLIEEIKGHEAINHLVYLKEDDESIWTNSSHHQAMDPRKLFLTEYKVYGVACMRSDKEQKGFVTYCDDYEILGFKKIRGFAVQGHPEWCGYDTQFAQYCLKKSKEFFDETIRG